VLFAAAAAVGLVLGKRKKVNITAPSLIMKTIIPIINILILAVGLSIILHGHLTPGGGFPGGAVIASGIILLALVFKNVYQTMVDRVLESVAGLGILFVGLMALTHKKPFFTNFLDSGKVGDLFSGGTVLLLYILIGIKVAVEIANISASFIENGEVF